MAWGKRRCPATSARVDTTRGQGLRRPQAPSIDIRRTCLMFLAKADIAALILHSFSAGVTSLLLLDAGVAGSGSDLGHLLSIVLLLVNSGTVCRVLGRGRRQRDRRGQAPMGA